MFLKLKGEAKDAMARALAQAHAASESTIRKVVRLRSVDEDDGTEPIKLLEVNAAAVPIGVWPIALLPDPPDFPVGFIVVDLSFGEYEDVVAGRLSLPNDWTLCETLFQSMPSNASTPDSADAFRRNAAPPTIVSP
ncbi:MAG: hypothetical protein ACRDD1_07600 [Planctomycetia bacterium]